MITLQETNISHQTGSWENHRLKYAKNFWGICDRSLEGISSQQAGLGLCLNQKWASRTHRAMLLRDVFRLIGHSFRASESVPTKNNSRLMTYVVFRKWWVENPQIIHFNRDFHYKSSILGYPYFWKHPYHTVDG